MKTCLRSFQPVSKGFEARSKFEVRLNVEFSDFLMIRALSELGMAILIAPF